MRSLEDRDGYFTTPITLQLAALTIVRTVELRRATWYQFDLCNATWRIPAET